MIIGLTFAITRCVDYNAIGSHSNNNSMVSLCMTNCKSKYSFVDWSQWYKSGVHGFIDTNKSFAYKFLHQRGLLWLQLPVFDTIFVHPFLFRFLKG